MGRKLLHIFLILIDSARADHFSCYGYKFPTTPNIDKLSEDSILYTNAFTPAGWTRPAVTSVFTGLWPECYGISEQRYLSSDMTTISKLLKDLYYNTFMLTNNPYVSPATGFGTGVDRFWCVNRSNFHSQIDHDILFRNISNFLKYQFYQVYKKRTLRIMLDLLIDQALKIIKEPAYKQIPVFLYLHLDVHHPYITDRKYLRRFLQNNYSEETIKDVERSQLDIHYFLNPHFSPEEKEVYFDILTAFYNTSLCKNDILIGLFVKALQKRNMYDNSMIIVTSDHGEYFGEHGLVSHGPYLYDQVIRVPLVVKYPKGMSQGGISSKFVSTIDLFPTICEIVGYDRKKVFQEVQGISLLSDHEHEFVISQRKNFPEGLPYWKGRYPHLSEYFDQYDYGDLIALRDKKYKFVWSSKERHALFDLETHPQEEVNLANKEPSICLSYLNKLEKWRKDLYRMEGESGASFDEAMRKQLRSLGYIE